LKSNGFEVRGFENGKDFFEGLKEDKPDLLLLDVMLPGEDGITILKTLRQDARYRQLPIIMLTAKGSELDKITGLDLGADDYISKPFSVMELVARVKAVLRRVYPEGSSKLVVGDVIIKVEEHTVTVAGKEVILTYKEFELLNYLMQNVGLVLSREKILETLWGLDFAGESRTVDMHIKALRRKLGSSGGMIVTVRGVGYKMEG
jgi:two-component system alkaline phosphatase synthesis response regulator PhoP